MRGAPASPSPQPAFDPLSPFKYVGGDPSVDFVDTADWTTRGPEVDRFTSYARVVEWAAGAEVLSPGASRRLSKLAAADPRRAESVRRDAVALRLALRRLFVALAANGNATPRALRELNDRWLLRATRELAVLPATGARALALGWPRLGDTLDSVLWPVIWHAAQLVASPDRARLRECDGVDCGWLFVDRSRNGLRRWCEMEVCGTREKTRKRRGMG